MLFLCFTNASCFALRKVLFTDSHNKASVLNLVYIKFDNQVCLHYSRSKQDRMLGMHLKIKARIPEAFLLSKVNSPNVSTTPITAMGCRQCLPCSVVQLKGKHCRKSHCRNGVVDTFGHKIPKAYKSFTKVCLVD